MSRPRKYPRIGSVTRKQRTKRRGATTCDNCNAAILPGDAYSVVDVQYTWFRGDDDVADVCRACERKRLDPHRLIKSLGARSANE